MWYSSGDSSDDNAGGSGEGDNYDRYRLSYSRGDNAGSGRQSDEYEILTLNLLSEDAVYCFIT